MRKYNSKRSRGCRFACGPFGARLIFALAAVLILHGAQGEQPATAADVPIDWDIATGRNVRWSVPLGSVTSGSPVAAGGKVFVGTNNAHGYLDRYPATIDLGVLLCFDAGSGRFLWQASSEKLASGRAHDWGMQGVSSRPLVEGDRLWYVTSRCEVVCLDTEGFLDHENDGPVQDEHPGEHEADVVWKLDMFNQLGVRPHEQSPCSPAADGTRLFVVTSNGVDQSHVKIPAPDAPSFVALDKRTGRVLWTDHSPGRNIMHSQWGSPLYAVLGGVPQVIFPGGDGWIYSFDPAGTPQGTSKLLWKFDINPKRSVFAMGGRRDRNEQSFSLTAYEDRVYCACGQDPEHGEGPGHIWCIDPTKRGDVSAELVVDPAQPKRPLPPERLAAPAGGIIIANPNSAVVWHYDQFDLNGDGVITPDETMHRSRSGVAIQDGFLFAADFSGYVHCLDAGSGRLFWTYDLFAACWCTPLIADHHAYACDEEGKVSIFRFPSRQPGTSSLPPLVAEIDMGNTIYAAPTAAAGVLYIATRNRLYAIAAGAGLIVP